jgi:hypothetical protein
MSGSIPPMFQKQASQEVFMPKAYFVVRATVADPARRKAFDAWYAKEHLPDASKTLGVKKAWRSWSQTDPSLHQATYEFSDEASLDRAMERLVADFNREWPDVTRTREIFVLAEEFGSWTSPTTRETKSERRYAVE